MGAVKNNYWEHLMAHSDNTEDWEFAAREIEKDKIGKTEFNLREAIAASIRECGREYTREIVEAELDG